MRQRREPDPLGDVSAFASLGDERRRALYDYISAQQRPVGRDEAAVAVGIGRPLAAYHLDLLAEAGLLDVTFARPDDRRGPGAGRPAKLYRRSGRALAAQAPARDYAFVARLLAEGTERGGPEQADAASDAARAEGRRLGAELSPRVNLEAALAARGYEPRREADGALRLQNCPFHDVATTHPQVVCNLNHAFLEGLLEGAGISDRTADLDPCEGSCCVVVRPHR
ncbi:MAG TPA: hypothetical protein VFM43_08140 [Gaiellaceae bacterium]|nr:hypothetical protein [Gaiellaceae bacterium]